MERITAFEGTRDATFYREFIADAAKELDIKYFHYLMQHKIMVTEKDNIYVQCLSEARKIREDALYHGETVEDINALIDRLEECKKPLFAWIQKRLREEGLLPPGECARVRC